MKSKIQQFLGKNHSWSTVGKAIARELIFLNHQVDLFSTDGIEHLDADLKPHLIGHKEPNNPQTFGRDPQGPYQLQFSYTAPHNFRNYLSHGKTNRIGMWAYEWKNALPNGFARACIQDCDILAVPSEFSRQCFIDAKISEKKIQVLSHGIAHDFFDRDTIYPLKTKKTFKILAVIAQTHLRKNISGLLEAYGKAFNKQDDVVLVLKAKNTPIKFPFDVSLNDCLKQFNEKFPNHAEVIVVSDFIEHMSDLYRAVDVVCSLTFCEAFYLPGIEALASGKLNIVSNWGGQLDFLNQNNALLIDGREEICNPASMYWSPQKAIWFKPNIDDAVDKLRYAHQHYQKLNQQLAGNRHLLRGRYSWSAIAQQLLSWC